MLAAHTLASSQTQFTLLTNTCTEVNSYAYSLLTTVLGTIIQVAARTKTLTLTCECRTTNEHGLKVIVLSCLVFISRRFVPSRRTCFFVLRSCLLSCRVVSSRVESAASNYCAAVHLTSSGSRQTGMLCCAVGRHMLCPVVCRLHCAVLIDRSSVTLAVTVNGKHLRDSCVCPIPSARARGTRMACDPIPTLFSTRPNLRVVAGAGAFSGAVAGGAAPVPPRAAARLLRFKEVSGFRLRSAPLHIASLLHFCFASRRVASLCCRTRAACARRAPRYLGSRAQPSGATPLEGPQIPPLGSCHCVYTAAAAAAEAGRQAASRRGEVALRSVPPIIVESAARRSEESSRVDALSERNDIFSVEILEPRAPTRV